MKIDIVVTDRRRCARKPLVAESETIPNRRPVSARTLAFGTAVAISVKSRGKAFAR